MPSYIDEAEHKFGIVKATAVASDTINKTFRSHDIGKSFICCIIPEQNIHNNMDENECIEHEPKMVLTSTSPREAEIVYLGID